MMPVRRSTSGPPRASELTRRLGFADREQADTAVAVYRCLRSTRVHRVSLTLRARRSEQFSQFERDSAVVLGFLFLDDFGDGAAKR